MKHLEQTLGSVFFFVFRFDPHMAASVRQSCRVYEALGGGDAYFYEMFCKENFGLLNLALLKTCFSYFLAFLKGPIRDDIFVLDLSKSKLKKVF